MVGRSFLIQRYCADSWPQVRGYWPFVVAGPSFGSWVVPGSLERTGGHILRPNVREVLARSFPDTTQMSLRLFHQEVAAESLLREGVLCALWSVDSPECAPSPLRWGLSLQHVCRELPLVRPPSSDEGEGLWRVDRAVAEYLSGMPTAAMAREYLAEDRLSLEPCAPPLP